MTQRGIETSKFYYIMVAHGRNHTKIYGINLIKMK